MPRAAPSPAATVTVTSEGTGLTQTVTSDAEGGYTFASLPAASYKIRVELASFKPAERVNLVLDAASRRTADFKLEVGDVPETVAVTATTSQVETQSGDVSRVITGAQVANIALNGRNYVQLLQLLPGSAITTTDPFSLGLNTTEQAINGVRSPLTYFLVDGADNMDNGANGATITQPVLHDLRSEGADLELQRGVRRPRGGDGQRRHQGRDPRIPRQRLRIPSRQRPRRAIVLRWRQAGAADVQQHWLHHRRADLARRLQCRSLQAVLLLWRGLEEESPGRDHGQHRADAGGTQRRLQCLLADGAQGSADGPGVSESCDSGGSILEERRRLARRLSAAEFLRTGRQLPRHRTNITDSREEVVRIDYVLSKDTQVSYRYSHNAVDIFNPFQGGNLGIVPGVRPRPGWTTVGSVQQTLSNALLNSASVSATRNQIQAGPDNSVLSRSALGLTYPEIYSSNRFGTGPDLTLTGFTGYNAGDYIKNQNLTIQFRDDLTKVAGEHAFKFGTQSAIARRIRTRGRARTGS